jgi:hypothetical protein
MIADIIRKTCYYSFSNYIKYEQLIILYNIDLLTSALKSICKEYKDVDISLLSRGDYIKFTKKIDNVFDYIVKYGEKMPKISFI